MYGIQSFAPSNDAITKKYLSFYEQVKEMGIKFSVIGGDN